MNRKQKNILIGLVFGILLVAKIGEAIREPVRMDIVDWLLIGLGVSVAILHYAPDKP